MSTVNYILVTTFPTCEYIIQLPMSTLRMLKRRKILDTALSKALVDSAHTPSHDGQLLLPVLPLPLHRLDLIRLKVVDLNRHGAGVGARVEGGAVLCGEADLALGAVDGPGQGGGGLEGLAAAEPEMDGCGLLDGGGGGEGAGDEVEVWDGGGGG